MSQKSKKLPPRLAKKSNLAGQRTTINQTLKKVLESEVLSSSKGKKGGFERKRPLTANSVVRDALEAESFIKPRKMACGGVAKLRLEQMIKPKKK